MPCAVGDSPRKDTPMIVEHRVWNDNEESKEGDENGNKQLEDYSYLKKEYEVAKIFDCICRFCLTLGVNFHRTRSTKERCISMIFVTFNCSINLYFIGYLAYLTLTKPFNSKYVASSICIGTWIFLAYWQYTCQPRKILAQLFEANKGIGSQNQPTRLRRVLKAFYIVVSFTVCYYFFLIASNWMEVKVDYWDEDIHHMFGDRRICTIAQLTSLYCKLCWGVALFVFVLLVHATNYEFVNFNEKVRSCNKECLTDEELSEYMLKLMKIHNHLTECVKLLDHMFNIYAFVMITTIIPTTIFSLFMVFRRPADAFCWAQLFLWPLVLFCVFSFFAFVNAPSELHKTIHNTKSSLCANTHIWFPYRPDVYHSALAFVAHLDQTNLGVSIWGFAVVSKPLVLTTISVMVTCLALFLQVGECNSSNPRLNQTPSH